MPKTKPKQEQETETITGAEAVVRSLLEEDVEVIFGYPGGAIMPVYDEVYKYRDRFQHILVRHEQGAAHAAEGYAWVNNKPGVCLATSGPGATNLVTGITDAMMDSLPMVCMAGQVPKDVIGTDAFQEAPVVEITESITKWNYQVQSPEEIPRVMKKAFHIATSGKPGPVMIDLCKNAQQETFEYEYPQTLDGIDVEDETNVPDRQPDIEQIQEAASLLNQAEKPYVLAGHGVLLGDAEEELQELVETGDFPVAVTHLGLSAIPVDHPNYVGILGMHGNYGPNMVTNDADVILAIGMRFSDRVTGRLEAYAPDAEVIHIEIDPKELGKNVPTSVPIQADAKLALQELNPRIDEGDYEDWFAEFEQYNQEEEEKVVKKDLSSSGNKIKMGNVARTLSNKIDEDSIIVADVGQHQMAAMRYIDYTTPGTHVTSGGSGTMGFALPAVIGAKFGQPDQEVIGFIGDGSLQMTIQELGTIAQEELEVNIIVLNNNFLGLVRQWQQLFFEERYSFVDFQNPDLIKVAEGFSIPGERVMKRENLSDSLDRMLNTSGAYLLEVVVEKEENVFPMMPAGAAVDEILLGPDDEL
jgi:acetolactate synthase-1/2/3 large subunit